MADRSLARCSILDLFFLCNKRFFGACIIELICILLVVKAFEQCPLILLKCSRLLLLEVLEENG